MALSLSAPSCCLALRGSQFPRQPWLNRGRSRLIALGNSNKRGLNGIMVRASSSCPFKPPDEPILKEVLTEPVAFLGGMFAGLLRLDLNEDPLKEWVTRTVEASGLTEEIDTEGSKPDEDYPQQIEIE